MLQECIQNLPILFLCMAGNIAAGTIASTTIDKIAFDKTVFINGVVRALITAIGLVIIAFAFDRVDLSGIGYTPSTVITTGIVVYATKLLVNTIKLLGLGNLFPSTQTKSRLANLENKMTTVEQTTTANTVRLNSVDAKISNTNTDETVG